jgi:alpha-L-fucosidase
VLKFHRVLSCVAFVGGTLFLARLAQPANKPALVEQFRDRGFGLFIHWGVDAPLGGVISHSLVGASADYQKRFFAELPEYFEPDNFHPEEWAKLAKLTGFRYVVFTTKHHAGFCMWNTKTTDFSVMHTPYGEDIFRQVVDAFRKQGLAIGVYYSPDDFWWLYKHNIPINREVKGVSPQETPDFLAYERAQLHELLTDYGPIDYLFFDGPAKQLTDYAWQLQPNVVITRGVMDTPEQYTPGTILPGAWEGNLTMGTEWPWKPTNETYKSGTKLIETIIETRSKGGNMLLNVGPKPDGSWPIEQESRLREIALWNFVNEEAITGTRPWVVTNEQNIWFTRGKEPDVVYAFLTGMSPWKLGDAREITLHSVRSTSQTQMSVLGQSDEIVEYLPNVKPKTTWSQEADGLHVKVYRAQRLYTNNEWPNPVVLKMTHVKSAF